MELVLRFDYGRSVPWVTRVEDNALRAISGPDMVTLRTPAELKGENWKTVSNFTVSAGETVPFVLTYGESYRRLPRAIDHERALRDTENFWTEWSARSNCKGRYSEIVHRSLITLKALTYRPTGGIVAAATTSLPEHLGGVRNWDYRYCWLRDATFTLLALMHGGFYAEARAWRDWLVRAAAGSPDQLQIMYGIRGERSLFERKISWLPGYENSKPVRVGNAASEQLQLDVYGEVADALLHAHTGGIQARQTDIDLLTALTEHLATIWEQPDEGIWEVRGGRQQFTYSKVMAWVAFDRSIKSAERFGFMGPLQKWREIRDMIHQQVCREAWNDQLHSFTRSYKSKSLDASLLLLPLVGFLPPSDPRVLGTLDAIQKFLMRDGLLLRYETDCGDDGLPPGDGAFVACSFWLVNVLCLVGRTDEASARFEELLKLRNDVGLLSEEYDPHLKRQIGNFPQALSHIALVNAAFEFCEGSSPVRQRAGS
jgi:GH15 family glucan-1,4-alpha-glucosidase